MATCVMSTAIPHPMNKGVICAKGATGIMKQVSPARLTQPLLRKPGTERGKAEFEPISWERALDILAERLAKIRATDPKKFAFFTGRDQMQALTGLFARQFGTPNYAAHGGFCSVNMAAGMIYTIGGSFWEFGGPDLERAKLFVMIGTAEDHHSNPLKIAIIKFKRGGGRFISINPVRTGYSAIADEWIPIKPGTDGALLMALMHELIAQDLIDHAFLKRYTSACWASAGIFSPRHATHRTCITRSSASRPKTTNKKMPANRAGTHKRTTLLLLLFFHRRRNDYDGAARFSGRSFGSRRTGRACRTLRTRNRSGNRDNRRRWSRGRRRHRNRLHNGLFLTSRKSQRSGDSRCCKYPMFHRFPLIFVGSPAASSRNRTYSGVQQSSA